MRSTRRVERYPCVCLNGHRTIGWQESAFLVFIMMGGMFAAIFIPYITAMVRKTMPAFIPFISQAGGSPPETGLLGIFMIISGLAGSILFVNFFESINHRNRYHSRWIRCFNYMAVPIVPMSLLGCVMTASFPIGQTKVPNLLEYVTTVLLEHIFGASMVLGGIVIYQFFLAALWWKLPDVTRTSKYIKIAFCVIYIISFFVVVKPLVDHIYEEFGPEPFNFEMLRNVTSYELPLVFSTNYKICAFLEWGICFLSLINLLTCYKDFKRISFHVTLRPKSCLSETREASPIFLLKSLP